MKPLLSCGPSASASAGAERGANNTQLRHFTQATQPTAAAICRTVNFAQLLLNSSFVRGRQTAEPAPDFPDNLLTFQPGTCLCCTATKPFQRCKGGKLYTCSLRPASCGRERLRFPDMGQGHPRGSPQRAPNWSLNAWKNHCWVLAFCPRWSFALAPIRGVRTRFPGFLRHCDLACRPSKGPNYIGHPRAAQAHSEQSLAASRGVKSCLGRRSRQPPRWIRRRRERRG